MFVDATHKLKIYSEPTNCKYRTRGRVEFFGKNMLQMMKVIDKLMAKAINIKIDGESPAMRDSPLRLSTRWPQVDYLHWQIDFNSFCPRFISHTKYTLLVRRTKYEFLF